MGKVQNATKKKESKHIGEVHARTNVRFVADGQGGGFLCFGHFTRNGCLILAKGQNKEIPFSGRVVKSDIRFWQDDRGRDFPFLVICHKTNICF